MMRMLCQRKQDESNEILNNLCFSGLSGRVIGNQLANPEVKSNLAELKGSLSEMQNLTSLSKESTSRVSEQRNSVFNSSRSSLNNSSNPAEAVLARGFNGLELPSLSSGEVDIDELSDAASAIPTVTSPLGTVEMPDTSDFGSDGSEKSGLTSPNMVSSMSSGGLNLTNASPLAKIPTMGAMVGNNFGSGESLVRHLQTQQSDHNDNSMSESS